MEAIVLARRDFREFDQIISFYTKEKGKVELLARGVKKMVSKNSAHLEPFSNVFVERVEGKEINHLTRAVPINFFPNIRKNLQKSLAAGYLVYFLEKITDLHEPDGKIYEIILDWLKFLDRDICFNQILSDSLILILLSRLGFAPILDRCVVCEKTAKELIKDCLSGGSSERAGFYFAGGGLICGDCRSKKTRIDEKVFDFSLQSISGLELLMKGNWRLISEFEFENKEKKMLHALIYEFVIFHSEKNISDWANLSKI